MSLAIAASPLTILRRMTSESVSSAYFSPGLSNYPLNPQGFSNIPVATPVSSPHCDFPDYIPLNLNLHSLYSFPSHFPKGEGL